MNHRPPSLGVGSRRMAGRAKPSKAGRRSGSGASRARLRTGPAEQGRGPDGFAGGEGRHAPMR